MPADHRGGVSMRRRSPVPSRRHVDAIVKNIFLSDREASRFATHGRNSAARQFAFAWMSSWLHLEHAYQARRHKPAVNNYCEGRYGARQSGRSIVRATTGMITILYACHGATMAGFCLPTSLLPLRLQYLVYVILTTVPL